MAQLAAPEGAIAQEPARPRRALGLWASMALVIGNIIGSGIFLLPASLAPFGGISIAGWLFTASTPTSRMQGSRSGTGMPTRITARPIWRVET